MSESPNTSTSGSLVACSLWLHVGLIGASALAAGLLQWFGGDPRLPWAPVVAFFGGMLAVASWRRGFAVLEQAERVSPGPANASSDSTARVPQSDRTRREYPVAPHSTAIEP